jgi:hypothetical protein
LLGTTISPIVNAKCRYNNFIEKIKVEIKFLNMQQQQNTLFSNILQWDCTTNINRILKNQYKLFWYVNFLISFLKDTIIFFNNISLIFYNLSE